MKIVYLKPFKRLHYFAMLDCWKYKVFKPQSNKFKKSAFSLIEMLMALLVASLLLAALAPVLTRKMNENVTVSGTGGVKGDYTRLFDKDGEWVVPNGVNIIDITAIGGGGAGGGATYGYQEFTSSVLGWKVPDGVTKLRVFMLGAGGSGASGGAGIGTAYGTFPGNSVWSEKSFRTTGETFWTVPSEYRAPALDQRCLSSGVTEWTFVADNSTTVVPGEGAYLQVTACAGGGGGGGDGGGSGGNGGYLENAILGIASSNLWIKVGGGGGYGYHTNNNSGAGGYGAGGGGVADATAGRGGAFGGNGGKLSGAGGMGEGAVTSKGGIRGYYSSYIGGNGGTGGIWGAGGGGGGVTSVPESGNTYGGGGGGGGGPTTITTSSGANVSDIVFQVGGGGGGGGRAYYSQRPKATGGSGGGGGGGGYGAGGGGGGNGKSYGGAGGSGGTFISKLIGGGDGNNGTMGDTTGGGGGNGGDGYGGNKTTIFGTSYCSGGGNQVSGKQGALQLYYGKKSENVIKCEYYQPANSGAGGGAGQMWVGEINVTPGQTIDFNVGIGGAKPTNYGEDGKNGGPTSIKAGGIAYTVSGGRGGTYQSDDTYIDNSKGLGGGIKVTSLGSGSTFNNWLNIPTNISADINDGGNGNLVLNGAGGGKGGSAYKMDGTLSKGGLGGNAQDNGKDGEGYGSGGGGGGGVVNDGSSPGLGGKGASGYIFIEWGSTNGGGGASGQVVEKKTVWVTPGTKIKMTIGKGGESNPILNTVNGVNGYFGQKGNNGTNTIIEIPNEATITAFGGEGGYPGESSHGIGGNGGDEAIENINNRIMENSIPGSNGTDDYGGSGGFIAENICPLLYELKKISQGGCGGNNSSDSGCYPSIGATGSKGYGIGSGGGGGSVRNSSAYSGGKGSDGAVIIQWSN